MPSNGGDPLTCVRSIDPLSRSKHPYPNGCVSYSAPSTVEPVGDLPGYSRFTIAVNSFQ